MNNFKTPIVYKTIPTQYAFLVSEDGRVEIQAVTRIEKTKYFETEAQARAWVEDYKVQL